MQFWSFRKCQCQRICQRWIRICWEQYIWSWWTEHHLCIFPFADSLGPIIPASIFQSYELEHLRTIWNVIPTFGKFIIVFLALYFGSTGPSVRKYTSARLKRTTHDDKEKLRFGQKINSSHKKVIVQVVMKSKLVSETRYEWNTYT